MNQHSVTPGRPPTRAPVFFWITVALLVMLLLGGAAAALLLMLAAGNINRSGGWGWLLVGAIYVVAITVVCSACALCAAVSLFRHEPHRRLSIAILIISCLVVSAFGPNLIRAVNSLRRQHDQAARTSEGTPRPPADSLRPATIPRTADKSSSAPVIRDVENPQILELKSNLWKAIRTKNAGAFVDCFYVEGTSSPSSGIRLSTRGMPMRQRTGPCVTVAAPCRPAVAATAPVLAGGFLTFLSDIAANWSHRPEQRRFIYISLACAALCVLAIIAARRLDTQTLSTALQRTRPAVTSVRQTATTFPITSMGRAYSDSR